MVIPRRAALAFVVAGVSAVCCAQQKFPLHAGEWEISTSFTGSTKPIVLRVCLNDELWTKALTQTNTCSVQNLSVSAKGLSYEMDCPSKTFDMKGKVDLTFEGKDHMSGRAAVDTTMNGSTSSSITVVDYRWKSTNCGPDDVNMKQPTATPAQPH
jgi:hypothetical protein